MKIKTGISIVAAVLAVAGNRSFAQGVVTGSALNIGSGNTLGASGSTIAGGQNNYNFTDYGVIAGGENNTVNANFDGTIGGGNGNIVSSVAPGGTISGGLGNQVRAEYGMIGGGAINKNGLGDESSGRYGFIGGGYANTNGAQYATIGGGLYNLIVTTDLFFYPSGSSIGGGIGNIVATALNPGTIAGGSYNYVSNEFGFVGGGNLNANGGAGGVIGGGSYNIVTGDFSTISGGQSNTVSGGWSVVGGGFSNSAAATTTVVGGGNANAAIGYGSAVAGGYHNTAVGQTSFVGAGQYNYVYANNGTVAGGSANTNFGIGGTIGGGLNNKIVGVLGSATIPGGANALADKYGQQAYASGQFAANGDAQTSLFVLRNSTTNSTPTELFLNGVNRRMLIATNSTWTFEVQVSGRNATGDSAGYRFDGVIENVSGTVAIVGSVAKTVLGEDDPSWDANVTADNVNRALVISVNGSSTNSVRWVSSVRTVEVIY